MISHRAGMQRLVPDGRRREIAAPTMLILARLGLRVLPPTAGFRSCGTRPSNTIQPRRVGRENRVRAARDGWPVLGPVLGWHDELHGQQ